MFTLLKEFLKSFSCVLFAFCCCLFLPEMSYGQDNKLGQSREPGVLHGKLIIEDIECRGNENTRCDFIRKKYYQHIGDTLDPDEISDARLRLGALIQFRDIKVHLEKGSERGYVIVVFVVREASHIQYNMDFNGFYQSTRSVLTTGVVDFSEAGSNFLQPLPYTIRDIEFREIRTEQAIFFGITDFNIFGTGKELGLSLAAANVDVNFWQVTQTGANKLADPIKYPLYTNLRLDQNSIYSSDFDYEDRNYLAGIHYHDPNLFSSPYYFMSAGYQKDYHYPSFGSDYKPDLKYLEVGRRFARFSSIALSTLRNWGIHYYTLKYGWDSQDDTILPTKGSYFKGSYISYDYEDSKNRPYRVDLDYSKHLEIYANKVLTFSAGGDYHTNADKPNYRAGFRFTNILERDAGRGTYTGWSISFRTSKVRLEGFGLLGIYQRVNNLGIEYTIQADSWVTRFGITYSRQREGNL